MAEVLRRAERHPSKITSLGFYVLAPNSRVAQGAFTKAMNKKSLLKKVQQRVSAYAGEKDEWFERWFLPTWQVIDIQCLCWEEIIETIQEHDSTAGDSIDLFYDYCLRFNQ